MTTLVRQSDGALEFRTPHGWLLPDVPPAPPVPDDPAGALRRANGIDGMRIDARTARPTWLGERVDIGYAIGVLHPLALRPSVMRE